MFNQNYVKGSSSGPVSDVSRKISSSFCSLPAENVVDVSTTEKGVTHQKIVLSKKFHFCGLSDCPDWVLAEIATLSRITSIKMKLLCTHVVDGILGTPIDFEKVNKLTSDAKYEIGDMKAAIAALLFIFTSSAKHCIEEESLLKNELQQLGLPKESTAALCKVYSEKYSLLQEKLKKDSLKLTELTSFDWQVNYVLSSSMLKEVRDSSVQLNLKVKKLYLSGEPELHMINMSANKFLLLYHELKQAYAIMEEISSSS